MDCACSALVGKPEGKRPLERPERGWQNNIKLYFQKLCWVGGGGGLDGFDFSQDWDICRDVVKNTVINLRVSIKCGEFFD